MLAICFRIVNPASNHYWGDIGRLGRAFAEAQGRPLLEQKILSIIEDNNLDDYNRLLMHYVFLNYTYYLDKKEDRLASIQKLKDADKKLPGYLIPQVAFKEEVIADDPDEKR